MNHTVRQFTSIDDGSRGRGDDEDGKFEPLARRSEPVVTDEMHRRALEAMRVELRRVREDLAGQ